MNRRLYLSVALSCCFFFACDKTKEKEQLRQELRAHYNAPADSLQRRAADFLLEHIDGLSTGESATDDLGHVKADYLIQNIDLAFQTAAEQLQEGSLPFADFCEYVLPHRLASEPLTPWREQCIREFGALRDTFQRADDRNLAVCKHINIAFYNELKYSMNAKPARYRSWEEMAKNKEGDCWLMTSVIEYPLRALGIAVTTDFVPMWSNSNGGPHAWNVMVTSKYGWTKFMGCERYPTFPADYDPLLTYHEFRRSGKVFRKTYSTNTTTLPHLLDDEDDIPFNLQFDRVIDVTDQYFPVSDVDLRLPSESTPEMVYLATFSNGEWIPVFWAKPRDNRCRFPKMAKGVVYLPCTYQGGKGVEALDKPFYIDENTGQKVTFRADLQRKTAIPVHYTRSKLMEEIAAFSLGRTGLALFQTMDSICLDQKRSAPLADKTYRLYYWDNGWQLAGEQKKTTASLQFENVPVGTFYRLLPQEPRNNERFFTYTGNQQIWW
ncbi:transglutaminase domain-containing protein [Larkinella bovis]|uniref:Transglutaminase domain-containing protein n=1 Tax=Larkinella bovis TaxID=683041 RepID=A0ABW0IAE5_9BACT